MLRVLPRVAAPAALRGCVGTLEDGYIKSVPLPCINAGTKRAPRARAAAAIQAMTVAILPIANMLGGAYNPFL